MRLISTHLFSTQQLTLKFKHNNIQSLQQWQCREVAEVADERIVRQVSAKWCGMRVCAHTIASSTRAHRATGVVHVDCNPQLPVCMCTASDTWSTRSSTPQHTPVPRSTTCLHIFCLTTANQQMRTCLYLRHAVRQSVHISGHTQ